MKYNLVMEWAGTGVMWGIMIGLLFILAVIYSSAIFMIRVERRAVEKIFNVCSKNLRFLQGKLGRCWREYLQYDGIQTEPYRDLVPELKYEYETSEQAFRKDLATYAQLKGQSHQLSLQKWTNQIGLPLVAFVWYRLHHQSQALLGKLDLSIECCEKLTEKISALANIPEKMAVRLNAIQEHVLKLDSQGKKLLDLNLGGESFEAVIDQIGKIKQAVEDAPALDDPDSDTYDANSDVFHRVGQVYEILSDAEAVLPEINNLLATWEHKYRRAKDQVEKMDAVLEEVSGVLRSFDDSINTSAQASHIKALQTIAQVLTSTLEKAEVESLDQITDEARRIAATAKDISFQLENAPHHLANLAAGIEITRIRQKLLSDQVSDLIASHEVPVIWEQSQDVLMNIGKELADILEIEQSPELEEIEKYLEKVEIIENKQRQLQRKLDKIKNQHAEIVAQAGQDFYKNFNDWLNQWNEFIPKTKRFSAKNWPSELRVDQLVSRCDALDLDFKMLKLNRIRSGIRETFMEELVEDLSAFETNYKKLNAILVQVRNRYEELVMQENMLKESLVNVQGNFQQIIWVIKSNPVLVQEYKTQIDKLTHQMDHLKKVVRSSEQGSLADKMELVAQFSEALQLASESWIEYLSQELSQLHSQIDSRLSKVTMYLTLRDPVVDRLMKFVRQPVRSMPGASAGASEADFTDQINQLKHINDLWQENNAALTEFSELVEKPLLEVYMSFDQARAMAFELVDKMRQLGLSGPWPPGIVDFEDELLEFAQLEHTWENLKQIELRAIWAVRRISELNTRYQAWCERGRQLLSWDRQQRIRFEKLEAEFNTALDAWRQQEQNNAGNPLVVAQIRKLKAKSNQALDEIKLRSRSIEGNTTIEDHHYEALYDFTHLVEKIRSFEIESNATGDSQNIISIRSEA